jgi:putative membrane protein
MEISKLAVDRGSGSTREFAEKMLNDHRVTSSQLKALVESGNVRVSFPAGLNATYQAKLDSLKGLRGADFENEFEKTQVNLHEEVVSLFERYGSGGSHPDLRIFAYRHLPHILEHWRLAGAPK